MNLKTIGIVGGVLIVAAFLLGFVPQYLKSRDMEKQLNSARQELASQGVKLQGDDLDLLIGYVYLQTNLKNYGLASEYSTKFFDRVRAMESQVSDANRQKFLQAALSKRDDVIAALAKGDPSTAPTVQQLFQSALETTETGWK
jgi:hypothetical protein